MAKNSKRINFSKLSCSQGAHKELMNYHRRKIENKSGNYDHHFVRLNYHSACIAQQKKLGRVLTPDEKAKEYDRVIYNFY